MSSITTRNKKILALYNDQYPISPEEIVSKLNLEIKPSTVKSIIAKAKREGLTEEAIKKQRQLDIRSTWHREIFLSSNNEPYVVIDTETTGLDNDDEVIEITIIDQSGAILLDTLVKPTCKIQPNTSKIHRIKNRDLKKAPDWKTVSDRFIKLTDGKQCVAYNAAFDRQKIARSFEAVGLRMPARKWICAMEAYKEMHNLKRWCKLTEAAARYGFATDNAHRALADARMALNVFQKIDCKKPGAIKRYPEIKRKKHKNTEVLKTLVLISKVISLILSIPLAIISGFYQGLPKKFRSIAAFILLLYLMITLTNP